MPVTLREFEAVFPSLVEDLGQHAITYGLPENALNWYRDVRKPSSFPVPVPEAFSAFVAKLFARCPFNCLCSDLSFTISSHALDIFHKPPTDLLPLDSP